MNSFHSKHLRWFSKLTVFMTLFLIFAGALVKSFSVGLSVPDWPTTYGYQMFAFPLADMVGGIFYEHGHRMLATFVGTLTLIMSIWLGVKESRKPVKILGYSALSLVIIQGLLGGLTVLYFLPTAISLLHGVTAQTFFMIVILIAFSLSKELNHHQLNDINRIPVIIFLSAVFIQLILGAWMRHTESGLAIYDFPQMAGAWLPIFDESMLAAINSWRFELGFDDVTFFQVFLHFAHRVGAIVIISLLVFTHFKMKQNFQFYSKKIKFNLYALDGLVTIQLFLGAYTIWTVKDPFITSFHVMNGAAVLGVGFLLLLRLSELKFLKGT